MENSIPNSVYGPVESWRLGNSLGIDMLCIDSICSFECIYCQLGKINRVTIDRDLFVSTAKVLQDLDKSEWHEVDAITFSGSGEPTLAINLGEVIGKVKKITGKPIVVLTNSTLLHLPEVRSEIINSDKIFCKLDAWSEEMLRRIDRPHDGVSFESIESGIKLLRQQFRGFLAIQTMILRMPSDLEIDRLAKVFDSIKPDEVQLNLPTRSVPRDYFLETRGNAVKHKQEFTELKTISAEKLETIRLKLAKITGFPVITRSYERL